MKQDFNLHDAYCLAPWVNIHINQENSIKPCCAWYEDYKFVENYFSGDEPSLTDLKTELATNNPSDFCLNCNERNWYDEFRTDQNEITDISDFSITSVDVRWGSTCQLNCVYCNEDWSSSWTKLINKNKVIPIKNSRIQETDNVFDLFAKHNIKRVSMLGGEPLLLKENLKLLNVISEDTHIEIFTNLNLDLDNNEVYQRLAARSNVNWYVSMENVGTKFEFVRRGATWEQQVSNLIRLKNTNPKSISLQSQYCAYSAFDLVDLYQFCSENNLHVNLVCGNFSIGVLDVFSYPKDFKILALEEINRCLEQFPESEFKLNPIKQKLINDMDIVVPNIIDNCVKWNQDREKNFFNNRFNFVDLWPQFGKTSL